MEGSHGMYAGSSSDSIDLSLTRALKRRSQYVHTYAIPEEHCISERC